MLMEEKNSGNENAHCARTLSVLEVKLEVMGMKTRARNVLAKCWGRTNERFLIDRRADGFRLPVYTSLLQQVLSQPTFLAGFRLIRQTTEKGQTIFYTDRSAGHLRKG